MRPQKRLSKWKIHCWSNF